MERQGRVLVLRQHRAVTDTARQGTVGVQDAELVRAGEVYTVALNVGHDLHIHRVVARRENLSREEVEVWVVLEGGVREHEFVVAEADSRAADRELDALDRALARSQSSEEDDRREVRAANLDRPRVVDLEERFVPTFGVAHGLILAQELECRAAGQGRVAIRQATAVERVSSALKKGQLLLLLHLRRGGRTTNEITIVVGGRRPHRGEDEEQRAREPHLFFGDEK